MTDKQEEITVLEERLSKMDSVQSSHSQDADRLTLELVVAQDKAKFLEIELGKYNTEIETKEKDIENNILEVVGISEQRENLKQMVEQLRFEIELQTQLDKMPTLTDVIISTLDKKQRANALFGEGISAEYDIDIVKHNLEKIEGHQAYQNNSALVINFVEIKKQYQKELEEMAKHTLQSNTRIFDPIVRLEKYSEAVLADNGLRSYIGIA